MQPLAELAAALRRGALSPAALLEEIEAAFAAREATVQAFVPEAGRFDRLRREAEALLRRFPDPAKRPPLFAVPVGVKDIFHVDGFETRAGSRLPPDVLRGPEAPSVSLLKQAGALILGKTVTTEFAYFGSGPTRNPHNPEHTPGGSSSGSAAGVAAGLCPLALGTQTIGSVIRPAAFCGVVGFKPSYERISRAGVIPLSPSVDHVGLFTADAAGMRLAAGVLCSNWQSEVGTLERPEIGVPEGPYLERAEAEALEHFREVRRRLSAAGYRVKAAPAMPDFADIQKRHETIVAGDAAQVHAEWFARFGGLYHPLTANMLREGQAVDPQALRRARRGRARLRIELTVLMHEHNLDLWIAPSATGPAPSGLESTGDPIMNLPWTHAGLPTVTLPAGTAANGLPLGVQVIGRWQQDERLLAWAVELEKVLAEGGVTHNA